MNTRDIVVVGGSAGSLDGIMNIVQGLTPDLGATLFIVMHSSEGSTGILPEIIARRTQLPVRVGRSGEAIRHGRVFLPPVDQHIMVERGRVRVTRGPKQNRFRPAVDPLFESAARSYGPRVVGIVLSGGLDDGAHGLSQIKRAGGITVVQDLGEAPVQGMPLSAMQAVEVDHILSTHAMGALIEALSRKPARKKMQVPRKRRAAYSARRRKGAKTLE